MHDDQGPMIADSEDEREEGKQDDGDGEDEDWEDAREVPSNGSQCSNGVM